MFGDKISENTRNKSYEIITHDIKALECVLCIQLLSPIAVYDYIFYLQTIT